ncbi:hypothetical protein JCM10213_000707 [Rhodosporidiobolus nylandii]
MLLSLPVELVERIVRLAVPHEYSSATYLERQDTLRSLCLVCRDLFPLAQRVLEETVRVSKPGTAKKVGKLLENDAKRANMRALALELYEVEAVKKGCAGLRDVRLSLMQDFELGWLEQSRNLLRLVLSQCELAAPYPHLPALRSMTWSNSYFAEDEDGRFLSRQHLPTLEDCAFSDRRGGKAAIFSPFFTDLAPSLKTLAVWDTAVDGGDSRGLATAEHSPAVLVDTAITTLIFRLPTILLTYLLLPTRFRPSVLPHGALRSSVETFLSACTARNITVDFEDTDESPGGSGTSPKFGAYVAEKRVKEKRETKHGG